MMGNVQFPAARHPAAAVAPNSGSQSPSPDAFVKTAGALLGRGQAAVALICLRKALALDPDHAAAHNVLGIVLQQLGQPEEALPHHHRALALAPEMAEAHASLGNAHRLLGHFEEAAGHYRDALAVRPDYPAVHNDLAGVLNMLGRTVEAIGHYESALSAQPDDANANYNVANLLGEAGRHEQALDYYARALRVQPQFPEAHNNMAAALQKLGRHGEAVPHYVAALKAKPRYAEAWHNLGKAWFALDRHDEATTAYKQALTVDPDNALIYNDLGATHLVRGQLREAYAAFAAAVARDPRNTSIHLNLATLAPFRADDPRLAALEKLAEMAPSLTGNQRIALNFALGKAHADLGNSERSFRHLCQGNALRREQISYDEAATLAEFTRVRAAFTPAIMRREKLGDPSPVPVFIVGMPRSGTTLLEQILASHSGVFGAGEIEDFAATVTEVAGAEGFPENVSALGAGELRRLGERYLERVTARAPHAQRITDKMLSNVNYVGLIHLALPNARIIHARRDPVDTCLSCFSLLFGADQPFTYDLAELGRYHRACTQLMQHWHKVLPQGVMLEVWYEDVVDDLEGQARRVLAHCGLEWEDRCLDFHRTERLVNTASVTQVRRPLYRSAVGRSLAYRELLRPLIEALEDDDGGGKRSSFAEGLTRLKPSRQAR